MKTDSQPPSISIFFGLTFFFSWAIWIPLVLSRWAIGPFQIPEGVSNLVRLLGVLIPAIVAISLMASKGSASQLFGRLKIWNVGWGWWAAAILGQPALLIAVGLLYNTFGEPRLPYQGQGLGGSFIAQIIMLAIATLGEEIGWRGLALPGLLKRHNALTASLILGLIWSTWHVPFWLLQSTYDQFGAGYILLNYLMVFPMSVYISWVFINSRGSVLLSAVFHLAFNIVNVSVFAVTSLIIPFIMFIALQWVIALVILQRYGAKDLSRELPTWRPSEST